jgi:hypothetical protein
MSLSRALALVLGALAAFPGMACSQRGTACAGPTCGAGYECLANRCAVAGDTPVPRDCERVVVSPVELAALVQGRVGTGSAVTLGRGGDGADLVFARFGAAYKGRAEIAAAFLLLTPIDGVEPSPTDVPLEVWTVASRWSADSLARGVRPAQARPMSRGFARSSPPTVVRLDVTDIVRGLAQSRGDDGIAIVARSTDGPGVTLATTAAGAPRLEVYLARGRPAAAAW